MSESIEEVSQVSGLDKTKAPAIEASLVGTEEGYQEFVRRAEALVPLLRTYAAEAEQIGRTPADVIAAMADCGLLKILRPARFGGYAQRAELMFDVAAVLGRGCMSTAWVFVNLAVHDLYVATWPMAAQEEIWSADPRALIGSSFVFPAGKARAVEGGYIVNGRWPFSSGVHPCDWNILAGVVAPAKESDAPEQRYFLLKREQYEILDTWHVAALRGTGSADVEAKEVFVPQHLTLKYVDLLQGKAEGIAHYSGASVRFPFAAAGGFVLLSPVYGAVRGAYEEYVEAAKTRTAKSSGKGLAAEPTLQSKVAEASVLLDSAEALIRCNFADIDCSIANGQNFAGKNALKIRRDSAYCLKQCVQAMDILFGLGGGSALYESNPLQRAWRDVHGGAAHIVFQWDVHGVAYGRVELGLPSGLPGMSV